MSTFRSSAGVVAVSFHDAAQTEEAPGGVASVERELALPAGVPTTPTPTLPLQLATSRL